MTTSRDLMITAVDVAADRPLDQGRLSLALAGAELVDLLADGTVTLDGDRIVPGRAPAMADQLLEQATSLLRHEPHESVEDWLWRRGRGLAAAYLSALENGGQVFRQRPRWMPFREARIVPADSPERRAAHERLASPEPVLTALTAVAGIRDRESAPVADGDEPVDIVLAAVDNASRELDAVRQQQDIEQSAFDNVWRGF